MVMSILFVDDDVNLLNSIARILTIERSDISYDLSESAEDALEKLEKNEYDVIVADHKMDNITGLTLLSIVRTKYPVMKRVMLSAQIHDDIYAEAEKLAHKYIPKPCDILKVIAEIENLF